MKLLIDVPSLLWQSLLAGKDKEYGRMVDFKGKDVWVNGWEFGMECAMNHLDVVMRELELTPKSMIVVTAGKMAKSRRQAIYSGYKDTRDARAPEAYEQFEKCKEVLCEKLRRSGASMVTQDGVEEDDMLAYLTKTLPGEIVILTRDGDMTTLIDDRVSLWQNGVLTKANKYGPFSHKFVPVYKALCGDGEEYKGAFKFGKGAFLDFLVWAGEPGLAAIEGMMIRHTLHELEEDVAEFKPLRKVIDSADHVYQSYECALLHDEWVNTKRQPLLIHGPIVGDMVMAADWAAAVNPVVVKVPRTEKNHAVFDCELIGTEYPVFLVCVHVLETGERRSFWWHVHGDMEALHEMLKRPELTWVSFNGIHFDAPLISAAIAGKDPLVLKRMANEIINGDGKSWQMPSQYEYDPIEFDHIDLIEVSPGVRTSLKTFAGRMGVKNMIDLPFHHDKDLNPEQCLVLENYCQNDLIGTETLFNRLRTEIHLREELSDEHGIDLRSKSDAQVAEAILKKAAGIKGRAGKTPAFVQYKAPGFIETDSDVINDLIQRMGETFFTINDGNGQVESPSYLDEPCQIGFGTYQFGVGGLHSTHDKQLFVVATDEMLISDFDVAGYYPKIMLIAGLTPRLEGGKGDVFIEEYRKIYDRRLEAKRSGNKKVANALKISLNGTFGKLGSPYSAFYSPDLMLAVTLTGQLNLACLIYDLESHPDIKVLSANTDGIAVHYPARLRQRVLNTVLANAERTGFEYEETRYSKIAMKDVNNYLAVTSGQESAIISKEDGVRYVPAKVEVKRKGLYAGKGLMKNPTMAVCSDMMIDFLKDGVSPDVSINKYTDMTDFVSIRAIKGGGIQYDSTIEVDDWVCVLDVGTKDNLWMRQKWHDEGRRFEDQGGGGAVKRKSRPAPVQIGVGGENFGRVARWFMSTKSTMPINYVGSGNMVPKTKGARLCMTLPDELPDDLDRSWYVREALEMLADVGVKVASVPDAKSDSVAETEVCV